MSIKIGDSNLQLHKYFSEGFETPDAKDIHKYQIKIFLGGKNRGKSYGAMMCPNGFRETLLHGGRVCYMRNSQEELKKQKNFLIRMVQELFPDRLIKSNQECIYDGDNYFEYVTFVSSKNYNKMSGNQQGYDLVFYDEFNQDLSVSTIRVLNDLPSLLSTIFRDKPINLYLCGNTVTQNNPIFNLFKIDMPKSSAKFQYYTIDDFLIVIRYDESAFTELVGDAKFNALIKEYAPESYNQMFKGDGEEENEGVVNRLEETVNQFENLQQKYFTKFNNRFYNIYENNSVTLGVHTLEPKGKYYPVNEMEQNLSTFEETIPYLSQEGCILHDNGLSRHREISQFYNDYNIFQYGITQSPVKNLKLIYE